VIEGLAHEQTRGMVNPREAGSYRPRSELAELTGIIVSCIVALLLISPVLKVPLLALPLVAFGSPLHLQLSRELVVGAFSGALAWLGFRALVVLHPSYSAGSHVYSHCILPTLSAIAISVFWQRQSGASIESRLIMAAAISLFLSLVMLGQYAAVDGESHWVVHLRTAMSVICLSVGLYLYIMIYGTRARSLVTASAVALLGACLALDILQYEADREWRVLRAAATIGLVLGECAWALNYWRVSPLRAGFLLLIVTYLLVGLTRRLLQGTLNAVALLEHATMAAILVAVMMRLSF
jgi:hypothetical protein